VDPGLLIGAFARTRRAIGYLGFKNARFGKIDAHIATCAFARDVLARTVHLAEDRGFKLIHAIVDSIWVKKAGATADTFRALAKKIEQAFQLPITFEGEYKWIVFLPSRTRRSLPVLNRYYGLFEDGRIKARGLEVRRRDTPELVKRCQAEMLRKLAEASNAEEFHTKIPEALNTLRSYIQVVRSGRAKLTDLITYRRLSKPLAEYRQHVAQFSAARQLRREGVKVHEGERVGFLFVHASNAIPGTRVLTEELVKPWSRYDKEEYVKLLLRSATNLLTPFYPRARNLRDLLTQREQMHLLHSFVNAQSKTLNPAT